MSQVVLISLVIALLWSFGPILHKFIYRSNICFETMTILSGLAYFIALIIFTAINRSKLMNDLQKLNATYLVLIAVSAIFTAFIANMLYYYIIKANPAFLVTALTYTAPLFTLCFAAYLLKERITKYHVIGILMIVGGVLMVTKASRPT